MCFRFSKMRLTTLWIFILIFIAILYITTADYLQCMRSCCRGADCTSVNLPMFDMNLCSDELCGVQCKRRYAVDCGSPDSRMEAMCMAPLSTTTATPMTTATCMSASHIFNQYTTLGAFILAFIATVMLRI
jgi:hypothetical protein